MSVKKKIVISLAAIAVILGVFVIAVMKEMLTPTQGAKIAAYADPQKALLIIDVQEDFTGLKVITSTWPFRATASAELVVPKSRPSVVFIRPSSPQTS